MVKFTYLAKIVDKNGKIVKDKIPAYDVDYIVLTGNQTIKVDGKRYSKNERDKNSVTPVSNMGDEDKPGDELTKDPVGKIKIQPSIIRYIFRKKEELTGQVTNVVRDGTIIFNDTESGDIELTGCSNAFSKEPPRPHKGEK